MSAEAIPQPQYGGPESEVSHDSRLTTHDSQPVLHSQFETLEQQNESAELGMWVFLATEVLFFGGLITAYVAYRHEFYAGFVAASRDTEYAIGTINTGVLLTSSLFMALAVRSAELGRRKALVGMLLLTILLGLAFMGLKGLEYYLDYTKHEVPGLDFRFSGPAPLAHQAAMFWTLYFFMTGLHAFHLTVGICVLAVVTVMAARGRFSPAQHTPVELTGLYWHFVDIVWVWLYPFIYLLGKHS